MPKIYDNIDYQMVDGLKLHLKGAKTADFCVGYFNLRGWRVIAEEIGELPETSRLLVGMQKLPVEILRENLHKLKKESEEELLDIDTKNKLKKRLAQEFKDQLTIGTPTETDEKALQKLAKQLKEGKISVRLHLAYPLHAKLYLAYFEKSVTPILGILGSSNLTFAGLSHQGELNIDVLEQDAAKKLAQWFEDRWEDDHSIDITKDLVKVIDESWATERLLQPYHLYLKMAYHLSSEARAGINQFNVPSKFKDELLDFQQKAVLVAARYLHKVGGVLLGDVVGLGKTITATALAKLFEDDFSLETLIICPANLVKMWEKYVLKYGLRAKVLPQGKAQTELKELGTYRLVIIDESHNLRNAEGKRYKAIKTYLQEKQSKVILLSATPYNKTYIDLSSQLRLFLPDDKDLGIMPEVYINSLKGLAYFKNKYPDVSERSIRAFEKSEFTQDWQELMRLFLVRRTRSFIKKHYAETDKKTGRKFITFADGKKRFFAQRIAKKVEYEFDATDQEDQYARLYSREVVEIIQSLNLPRYGLGKYLDDNFRGNAQTEEIKKGLTKAGKRLIGFCRTNLFKRLESSGYCFLLSLQRHIMRNYTFIYALLHDKPLPIGTNSIAEFDDFFSDEDFEQNDHEKEDEEKPEEEDLQQNAEKLYDVYSKKYKKRFKWVESKAFKKELLEDLQKDIEQILRILEIAKSWNPEKDRQLNALHTLITKTHQNEKVLIFTQFADTAYYLERELKKRGVDRFDCVTGKSEDPTTSAYRFSPISNETTGIKGTKGETRVLIATDVLSEGQNLQDARIVVNYDLPWAIIRLIQRAGRVDRIGQEAEEILCYSFLPEDGIENIINLRGRLAKRISENEEVVGSDEALFEDDAIDEDTLKELYNENSQLLEETESDEEVDLASYAYQIWKEATDKEPALAKLIPEMSKVIFATKKSLQPEEKQGVIVYAHTSHENDMLAWLDTAGNIITQSQFAILKAATCLPNTIPQARQEKHHELVAQAIAHLQEEEKSTGGTLGSPSGLKYKTYNRLKHFYEKNINSLFATESLKRAINDIFHFPLKEYAIEALNRQVKFDIKDDQLANLVVSLWEEDKLCIINQKNENNDHSPQIICSLGII